ncbi:MAG: CoA transferase [Rhodospirillaceae bacterium]|jgi:crotonobetainyl-CoA:carnitine CoA-transferase CaiB-like acyl-CoA transferase|nr:CoA transferase [Rhodospirillaceae bacterium]MBT5564249.1 CoA transferase [Rhodospirillaceae bacterium]MBT6088814.1 CoA transferase [Rhodospirillaceae bacterium]MBT6961600.1 CoA transferase [Rhodospirillaceae bacterium]MBT7449355.1 CoA transferase [Rhodospirillaceae bacterium]
MSLPLSGLRVLTMEQYGAGPYCSMFMADMGAEVIKVENPSSGGDFARSTGPYFLGENDSQYFQAFNLNKRSLTLDLKTEKGQEVLHKLVKESDAIVNNMRGNQPAKLGIDYAALKSVNPKIVCGHISAYGRDNSRAAWPGYDYLMQAEAGFLSVTGEPDGPPARFGLSLVDFMTGTMLAYGVTAAIVKAKETGEGGDVDVSLMEAALHQLTYPGVWYLNEGLVTGRAPRGAHPSVTPSQLVKSQDGWVFIMCQNPKFWGLLIDGLDRKELGEDPRFADLAARLENRAALTVILDEVFSKMSTEAWVEKFKGIIPISPVYDMAQALDNPFLEEIDMITEVDHPDRPGLRVLNNPIKLDGKRVPIRSAPKLGADTDELLKDIGYDDEGIAALRDAGAI